MTKTMQTIDKPLSNEKSTTSEQTMKMSGKSRQNKTSDQNCIEISLMKPQMGLDSHKTSPNKAINAFVAKSNDKKSSNNNNKRTKGPLNHIKARLNLNISASKSISSLRPTHVFANNTAKVNSRSEGQACSSDVPELASGVEVIASHRAQDSNEQRVHHSFISDITDVRQMENTLLTLLEDFHSGKLQAFGQDITFEKMESVREQQERLARLHFDLNLQQEVYGHQSEEGKRIAKDNMTKLIENLQQLSNSIEQLQSKSSVANTGS